MRTASSLLLVSAIVLLTVAAAPRAQAQEQPSYEFKIEQVKAQPTMSTQFRAPPEELGAKFGEAFGKVFGYVMSSGGQLTGPPFGRYHGMGDDLVHVEAGLPVAKVLPAKGEVKPSELPGGTVVTTVHVGPYEKLSAAHEALQKWVRDNGKKAIGGPWESYLTDPGEQTDPNKYETKLFQPIEAPGAAKTQ